MWNENLFQAFLKMDDETIQKMLDKLRYIFEVDTGRNSTPAFQWYKNKSKQWRFNKKERRQRQNGGGDKKR